MPATEVVALRVTEQESDRLVELATELECNVSDAIRHLLAKADPAFRGPVRYEETS